MIRVYFVIHFLETRKKLLLWTTHTYRTQCPYFSEELLSTEEIKKRSLFLLLSCKSDHCHYTPSLPCLHFVLILLWKNSYSSLLSFIFTQETTEEETNFILILQILPLIQSTRKSLQYTGARNMFFYCVPEMYSPVRYHRHVKHLFGCYGFRSSIVLVTKINHFLQTWREWRKNYKGIQKAALKLEGSRLLSRNTGICVTLKRIRISFWRKKKTVCTSSVQNCKLRRHLGHLCCQQRINIPSCTLGQNNTSRRAWI